MCETSLVSYKVLFLFMNSAGYCGVYQDITSFVSVDGQTLQRKASLFTRAGKQPHTTGARSWWCQVALLIMLLNAGNLWFGC